VIRVLSPGMQTTVQDLGRLGYADIGVAAGGAADALSLRAGNRLVGNAECAAALEMTLVGGAFEFEEDAVAALCGAAPEGAPAWEPLRLRAGDVLRCGALTGGARCYLCVRGGIDVPLVMGSASTHLTTGLGGLEGRALRRGDALAIGRAAVGRVMKRRSVAPPGAGALRVAVLRVTAGPQAEWFGDELYQGAYRVSEHSNRMGLRLEGPTMTPCEPGEMLTQGLSPGAVQAPPEGKPIVLGVEHGTTGGYPTPAIVISADRHALGQLRPRDEIGFERVTIAAALDLLRAQEAWLDALGG
jgi:antagonist of KipI